MSSAYCFIIHISLYGILRLHNLYLEDLIEKNVYTYQVSELFGSLVIMFNLFYYQIKIYRCSNIFCDTYEIRWSSFARSTHPSLVAEEPYWFAVTGPWPTFLKLVFYVVTFYTLVFFWRIGFPLWTPMAGWVAGDQMFSLSKSNSCISLKLCHNALKLNILPMVDNQLNHHRFFWIMALDLSKVLPNVSAL